MTAAMIFEKQEPALARDAAINAEPHMISSARDGDAASIAALLDLTSDRVYAYAFEATHKSAAAERITEAVIQRLPRVLRRQRWASVDALMAALIDIARSEATAYGRRAMRSQEQRAVRAWTRHAILAATSVASIAYAFVLAF